MSIYLLFLLILRLFTLFVNTAMSFTYHFKFRGDYLRTLSNTFNRKNSEWNSDTKNVRFKNFSIQYSTKFDIEKQSDGSNKKPKGKFINSAIFCDTLKCELKSYYYWRNKQVTAALQSLDIFQALRNIRHVLFFSDLSKSFDGSQKYH